MAGQVAVHRHHHRHHRRHRRHHATTTHRRRQPEVIDSSVYSPRAADRLGRTRVRAIGANAEPCVKPAGDVVAEWPWEAMKALGRNRESASE